MNFVKKDLAPGITVYRPEFKDLNNIKVFSIQNNKNFYYKNTRCKNKKF